MKVTPSVSEVSRAVHILGPVSGLYNIWLPVNQSLLGHVMRLLLPKMEEVFLPLPEHTDTCFSSCCCRNSALLVFVHSLLYMVIYVLPIYL